MKWDEKLWRKSIEEFEDFILPLVSTTGRSERRVAATCYVEGLLLPGQRKSIEPMAQRLGIDSQRLQQFITDSPWDEGAMWRMIRQEVIPHFEPIEAWIVDETGWLKQGRHSVGVARQYCGAVGKTASCQVAVEVTVSDGLVAAPIAGQLYLPKAWTEHSQRRKTGGVPPQIVFKTKPELSLELIEQALIDEVEKAPVLGDSVYGDSGRFRERLRELQMEFFVQVTPTSHKGWNFEVETELKKTRRHVVDNAPPSQSLVELTDGIPDKKWKNCTWTSVDGESHSTRIAWTRVYLPHPLRYTGGELEKVWLVVDWPEEDKAPYHYYLAHLHRPPTRARCLKLSRSRWHIEQYYRRSKNDLGLDHFEGRSWCGFHHHLVLSAVAYLFILTVYLRNKKNFWAHVGTDAQRDPPVLAEIGRLLLLLRDPV